MYPPFDPKMRWAKWVVGSARRSCDVLLSAEPIPRYLRQTSEQHCPHTPPPPPAGRLASGLGSPVQPTRSGCRNARGRPASMALDGPPPKKTRPGGAPAHPLSPCLPACHLKPDRPKDGPAATYDAIVGTRVPDARAPLREGPLDPGPRASKAANNSRPAATLAARQPRGLIRHMACLPHRAGRAWIREGGWLGSNKALSSSGVLTWRCRSNQGMQQNRVAGLGNHQWWADSISAAPDDAGAKYFVDEPFGVPWFCLTWPHQHAQPTLGELQLHGDMYEYISLPDFGFARRPMHGHNGARLPRHTCLCAGPWAALRRGKHASDWTSAIKARPCAARTPCNVHVLDATHSSNSIQYNKNKAQMPAVTYMGSKLQPASCCISLDLVLQYTGQILGGRQDRLVGSRQLSWIASFGSNPRSRNPTPKPRPHTMGFVMFPTPLLKPEIWGKGSQQAMQARLENMGKNGPASAQDGLLPFWGAIEAAIEAATRACRSIIALDYKDPRPTKAWHRHRTPDTGHRTPTPFPGVPSPHPPSLARWDSIETGDMMGLGSQTPENIGVTASGHTSSMHDFVAMRWQGTRVCCTRMGNKSAGIASARAGKLSRRDVDYGNAQKKGDGNNSKKRGEGLIAGNRLSVSKLTVARLAVTVAMVALPLPVAQTCNVPWLGGYPVSRCFCCRGKGVKRERMRSTELGAI
ncbi:hypothetical protein HRG_014165 [Hirsutella rhossiliensis]